MRVNVRARAVFSALVTPGLVAMTIGLGGGSVRIAKRPRIPLRRSPESRRGSPINRHQLLVATVDEKRAIAVDDEDLKGNPMTFESGSAGGAEAVILQQRGQFGHRLRPARQAGKA